MLPGNDFRAGLDNDCVCYNSLQAVTEIKKILVKGPSHAASGTGKKLTVTLDLFIRGNPQETHRTDFNVICNGTDMDQLPTAIFVEASSSSSPIEAALEEISRQLSGPNPPSIGDVTANKALD